MRRKYVSFLVSHIHASRDANSALIHTPGFSNRSHSVIVKRALFQHPAQNRVVTPWYSLQKYFSSTGIHNQVGHAGLRPNENKNNLHSRNRPGKQGEIKFTILASEKLSGLNSQHSNELDFADVQLLKAAMAQKRSSADGSFHSRKKQRKDKHRRFEESKKIGSIVWNDGSNDEILSKEVKLLLKKHENQAVGVEAALEMFQEMTIKILELSSTGEGLGLTSDYRHVIVVPFTLPGDTVVAKPYFGNKNDSYSRADFVRVVKPSVKRYDSEVKCQYFGKCGGCQIQMMISKDQLEHKRDVVVRAYRNFVGIDPSLMPEVEPTLASPMSYGYRTKLTPHFDGPPGGSRAKRKGHKAHFEEVPPIGFGIKGRRNVMDIEDCPLGTEAVRCGLKKERARVIETIDTFTNGSTILVRETTNRVPKGPDVKRENFSAPIVVEKEDYWEVKDYMTNHKGTIKEYIGDHLVTNEANSFFQNNNSILPPFIDYIRKLAIPNTPSHQKISYLVDAYCGSGLFTITLSSIFKESIGIDIDPNSIRFARENARLNNLDKTEFIPATASEIFKSINFPASETVVVVDPPRKGCDMPFLTQLMKFGPERIIYVSCNVHTQARDVGILIGGIPDLDAGYGTGKGAYAIESLRGCDFFPQTAHVEAVAVLQKKTILDNINGESTGET